MIAAIETLAALPPLDPAGCPFDLRLDVKFGEALARLTAGLVDEGDFDNKRAGWTAGEVLAHARATQSGHGAPRPGPRRRLPAQPHIWSPDHGAAMLDLGRFGLADPTRNLALFLRSAGSSTSPTSTPPPCCGSTIPWRTWMRRRASSTG